VFTNLTTPQKQRLTVIAICAAFFLGSMAFTLYTWAERAISSSDNAGSSYPPSMVRLTEGQFAGKLIPAGA
jgi:hypothetical protein